MKKYIFLTLFLLTLFFVYPQKSSFGATVFTRNMRLGTEGNDVLELQKFLNKSADTRIANTGNGSPSNETTYFGTRTQNAVIRFQEKYKNEVLTPAGVFKGTGFVGEFTRKKLNALQNEYQILVPPAQTPTLPTQNPPVTQITPPVQVTPPVVIADTTPHIDSITPPSGIDGTVITIRGSNFSPTNNTLLTGWGIFNNVPSSDGKTLIVTVKSGMSDVGKTRNLPYIFSLYVKIDKQISNSASFTLMLEPGRVPVSQEKRDIYKQRVIDYLKQKGYVVSQ